MEQLSFNSSSFSGHHILTVPELNAYIRRKLERDNFLQGVWVKGEISNWKRAASGHIYFTLKEERASIRCVIWRSQAQRLLYLPQSDGEAVLAHGRISVYEVGGTYQFYVDDLEPVGEGDLYAEFERLKRRLESEGLFDPERKQLLPSFPACVGVVTSPDGAALQDILNVLRRRYPVVRVILSPTPVQGESAPPQIVAALKAIAHQPVDLIILARGGGSLEDLWAFNNEVLARTIVDCPIPIITGVGHEVDFSIADFVADLRAPTPSAAAELATPDQVELKRLIETYKESLTEMVQQFVTTAQRDLQQQQWGLDRLSPQRSIDTFRQQIDSLTIQMQREVKYSLPYQKERLKTLSTHLETLNPKATLKRGYAIVQKGEHLIARVEQVEKGDKINIYLEDGEFGAVVE